MTLLQEIKEDAQNSRVDISDLLRKCMELAVYLENEELETWVTNELNGYPNKEEIPKYRIMNVASFGDFRGAWGEIYGNLPIPTSPLKEPFLDFATRHYFGGSISSFVSMINNKGGYNKILWPPEVCQTIGSHVYRDLACLHAWKLIPNCAIASIADNVRTKILKFALEIEKEDPHIGETPGEASHIDSSHVTLMVENIIMAENIRNLVQGGSKMGEGTTFNVGSQQAGGDIIQAGRDIYQVARDLTISSSSSASDVLKVAEAIRRKIKESDIDEKNKTKACNHLANAIVELEDKNPDKKSIANSMKQTNEILNEAKITGETLKDIGVLIGKVAIWLGIASL